LSQAVVRLDGQYGDGAIVADLAGLAYVMRGKDYHLLDQPVVQVRLLAPLMLSSPIRKVERSGPSSIFHVFT
jgi:hypothetical protein